MDLYAQLMELFALLTPDEQAAILDAARLLVSRRPDAPDADADE